MLDGVRVVELGHILLAPYATQFLGDFGADVIKVEAPEGDYYRRLGASRVPGMTAQWMAVNRNKRSIALDLKSPEGRAALLEMLSQADIVVHNMRVPAIERLGLGYDAVREVNPRIVYCAAIGFGQDGPYADLPAFDDLIQARSGLAEANGRNLIRDAERRLELGRDALEEMERRRTRFLKAFRQLLERELDLVDVEDERAPLEDRPIDLDLGGGRFSSSAVEEVSAAMEAEESADGEIEEAAAEPGAEEASEEAADDAQALLLSLEADEDG